MRIVIIIIIIIVGYLIYCALTVKVPENDGWKPED